MTGPRRTMAPSRARLALSMLLFVVGCGTSDTGGDGPAADAAVPTAGALPADTAARAPEGVRVRVRVLNGSGRSGIARRATQQLRDLGFDVVDYTNGGDTTRVTDIQVTSATRAWGERVAKALGTGTVREREGNLGYADVVVVLGHDWQPSPQTLRP